MPQEVNVGLIGYSFMGKAHSHAFKDMSFFFPEAAAYPVMKAICGRNEERTKEFAEQWGYESTESDWKALIARDDIDAIDICTPNNTQLTRYSEAGLVKAGCIQVSFKEYFVHKILLRKFLSIFVVGRSRQS